MPCLGVVYISEGIRKKMEKESELKELINELQENTQIQLELIGRLSLRNSAQKLTKRSVK